MFRLRQRRQEPAPPQEFLFVLTYGRSGSTLLQALLNAIPGYLIRGENNDAVYHLFCFDRDAKHGRRKHGSSSTQSGVSSAWYGIDGYRRAAALRQMRRLVVTTLIRPGAADRVLGFKEIRYDKDDLPRYVDFLGEVFPGARFVVNTRDLDAVATSGWWVDDPDARTTLGRAEERLLEVLERLGPVRAHRIHYDDYVADPEALRPFYDWLGAPFDSAVVRSVLDRPHSYDPRQPPSGG